MYDVQAGNFFYELCFYLYDTNLFYDHVRKEPQWPKKKENQIKFQDQWVHGILFIILDNQVLHYSQKPGAMKDNEIYIRFI